MDIGYHRNFYMNFHLKDDLQTEFIGLIKRSDARERERERA